MGRSPFSLTDVAVDVLGVWPHERDLDLEAAANAELIPEATSFASPLVQVHPEVVVTPIAEQAAEEVPHLVGDALLVACQLGYEHAVLLICFYFVEEHDNLLSG